MQLVFLNSRFFISLGIWNVPLTPSVFWLGNLNSLPIPIHTCVWRATRKVECPSQEHNACFQLLTSEFQEQCIDCSYWQTSPDQTGMKADEKWLPTEPDVFAGRQVGRHACKDTPFNSNILSHLTKGQWWILFTSNPDECNEFKLILRDYK